MGHVNYMILVLHLDTVKLDDCKNPDKQYCRIILDKTD